MCVCVFMGTSSPVRAEKWLIRDDEKAIAISLLWLAVSGWRLSV